MVKDSKAQTLFIDFGRTGESVIDIDGLHVDDDGFLFLIEVKNANYTKSPKTTRQREILQTIVDNYAKGGAILFMVHDKTYQCGDTNVDISGYPVNSFYLEGNWYKPKQAVSMHEVMDRIRIYESTKI